MPRGKKKNKPAAAQGNRQKPQQWGEVQLGGFRMSFPKPRIPRLLGAARNLGNSMSVYPTVDLDMPITQVNQPITAGAVAVSVALNFSLVDNFSTRIATLFREYAIVGVKLEIRINNVTSPAGVLACFIEEETNAAPTAAKALNRPRLDVLICQQTVPGAYTLTWTPRDLLDLDYVDTATSFNPAYVNLYTDVANFGTLAGTAAEVIITGAIAFTFRGFV